MARKQYTALIHEVLRCRRGQTDSGDPHTIVAAVGREPIHHGFVFGGGRAPDRDRTALPHDDRPRIERPLDRRETSVAKSRIENTGSIEPSDGLHGDALHRRDDAALAIERHVRDPRNTVDHDAPLAQR
ncbi:MAG TPA: hypothetical protein VIX73_17865 [Kofleriaceae bacterium]